MVCVRNSRALCRQRINRFHQIICIEFSEKNSEARFKLGTSQRCRAFETVELERIINRGLVLCVAPRYL